MSPRSGFWDKVGVREHSECWLWLAAKGSKGYGVVTVSGKMYAAHRYAWFLHTGEMPDGECVCHVCDTPLCCNPAHLFLGSTAENTADMVAKGRKVAVSGEDHWCATLSDEQVLGIRAGRYGNASEAARALGVDFQAVYRVLKRMTWKHL